MGSTPPPVYTVSHVLVSIADIADAGNMSTLLFSSCSPPDWSVEAPKHIFHSNQGGTESLIAAVQQPQYGTMTLTQGWDDTHVLAKWKYLIEQPGDITTKKKAVDVTFCKSDGSTLFKWHTDAGLLTGYSHSASDASSNGVLTVTATIDADTWVLSDDSGPLQ
jgi:T4-like virus tail tube protein gp19